MGRLQGGEWRLFRREIGEYLQAGHSEPPQIALLRQHYVLTVVTPFSDLELYEFRTASPPLETGGSQ